MSARCFRPFQSARSSSGPPWCRLCPEPFGAHHAQLPFAGLRNLLAPLHHRADRDPEDFRQGLDATSALNCLIGFHARYFSSLNPPAQVR